MNKDGKYEKEDLVRIAQAAFGPSIEIDTLKGTGYYVDLMKNDGPIKVKKVCRIADAKTADLLARKILELAGVEHKRWTEVINEKKTPCWEPLNDVCRRVRAERERLLSLIEEKLTGKQKGVAHEASRF